MIDTVPTIELDLLFPLFSTTNISINSESLTLDECAVSAKKNASKMNTLHHSLSLKELTHSTVCLLLPWFPLSFI